MNYAYFLRLLFVLMNQHNQSSTGDGVIRGENSLARQYVQHLLANRSPEA